MPSVDQAAEALDTVEVICRKYRITALDGFLESCRDFAAAKDLSIAVLGRFKSGKSSFLNHLLGKAVLPVGVVPVTAVVTEVQYGAEEGSEVDFLDGHSEAVSLDSISSFISENENPENRRQVSRVRVRVPSLEQYPGVRFVDTPGLESVFAHNTAASLEWLPNVGLALVTISADVPLSQSDLEFIHNVRRYTPAISLLLTKADILNDSQLRQVAEFVGQQLQRAVDFPVRVFPYSVRPGFETLRISLDEFLLASAKGGSEGKNAAILRHKTDSLLYQCSECLNVALKAAEQSDSAKEALARRIFGEKEALEGTRLPLRLIVRHVSASLRGRFDTVLQKHESEIQTRLKIELDDRFPSWSRSLASAMEGFDAWMCASLSQEMTRLSHRHRPDFVLPLQNAAARLSQTLQDFRNRISDRLMESLGVSLRTTEIEFRIDDPKSPDIRLGKIFDRNWELLSFLLPMSLIRLAVRKHFESRIPTMLFANLSRLAFQWEQAVQASLEAAGEESLRRLDGITATVERLIASSSDKAPEIRADLSRLGRLRTSIPQRGPAVGAVVAAAERDYEAAEADLRKLRS